MMWTAEQDQFLTRNWGKVATPKLADMLNTTRNSVIGRAYRIALPRLKEGYPGGKPRTDNPFRRTRKRVVREDAFEPRPPREARVERPKRIRFREVLPEPPVPTVAVEPLNIPFMDRKSGQCGFIVEGHGYQSLVCGHPSPEGSSWCSWHSGLVYLPRKPKTTAPRPALFGSPSFRRERMYA